MCQELFVPQGRRIYGDNGNNTWAAVIEKVQSHTDDIEATLKQKLADAEARDKGECLEFGVEVGKKTQRVIARADGL